jgi:ABC-2 type transport system ATP-binding protein
MVTPSHAVRLAQVRRHFGPVQALAGLDLALAPGETVALLGRNGAGKSTAIGLLLGLDEPDAGSVELFGRTPRAAVGAGLVGAMLQDARPIPRVTVRELTTFIASAYPRPMRPGEALALAGIAELADRRVDKLSGGQAQRLRFALAVTGNPALIVLDEPTAALDVEARRAFWQSMRSYAARGNTVLFSTHYLEEADENADRIVVVDRGRAVADGTGEQIKRRVGGTLVSFDLAGRGSEGLRSLPGVTAVEIRGDRAVLRTGDSDATVVALARADLIRGLAVTPASLEDAFLTLTAHAGPHDPGSHDPGPYDPGPAGPDEHAAGPRTATPDRPAAASRLEAAR